MPGLVHVCSCTFWLSFQLEPTLVNVCGTFHFVLRGNDNVTSRARAICVRLLLLGCKSHSHLQQVVVAHLACHSLAADGSFKHWKRHFSCLRTVGTFLWVFDFWKGTFSLEENDLLIDCVLIKIISYALSNAVHCLHEEHAMLEKSLHDGCFPFLLTWSVTWCEKCQKGHCCHLKGFGQTNCTSKTENMSRQTCLANTMLSILAKTMHEQNFWHPVSLACALFHNGASFHRELLKLFVVLGFILDIMFKTKLDFIEHATCTWCERTQH